MPYWDRRRQTENCSRQGRYLLFYWAIEDRHSIFQYAKSYSILLVVVENSIVAFLDLTKTGGQKLTADAHNESSRNCLIQYTHYWGVVNIHVTETEKLLVDAIFCLLDRSEIIRHKVPYKKSKLDSGIIWRIKTYIMCNYFPSDRQSLEEGTK